MPSSNKNRAYIKRRNANRRARSFQWFQHYKSDKSCITCGEKRPILIDFDHRDPAQKSMPVHDFYTVIRRGWAISRIEAELQKCDPLCITCHIKNTNPRSAHSKNDN